MPTLTCAVCGATFQGRNRNVKYCSPKCYRAGRAYSESARRESLRSDVAGRAGGRTPSPSSGSPPPTPTQTYQSHACKRLDPMTAAFVYARAVITDGYVVTVLRDGEEVVVRFRAPSVSTGQSDSTCQFESKPAVDSCGVAGGLPCR